MNTEEALDKIAQCFTAITGCEATALRAQDITPLPSLKRADPWVNPLVWQDQLERATEGKTIAYVRGTGGRAFDDLQKALRAQGTEFQSILNAGEYFKLFGKREGTYVDGVRFADPLTAVSVMEKYLADLKLRRHRLGEAMPILKNISSYFERSGDYITFSDWVSDASAKQLANENILLGARNEERIADGWRSSAGTSYSDVNIDALKRADINLYKKADLDRLKETDRTSRNAGSGRSVY